MSGLSPGTRFGAYLILAELGRGGMGEVYRARDSKLDRDVALKILPDVFAGDPDRVARFEREAKTLAALNHPNIAHIYDAGSFERGAYLAMELVEGQDLSELIGNGALPLEDALAIARQIATALEAAHEQGIIHRDLKPANVKVRGDGMVKVLDFGLAKAIDRTLDSGPGTLDPMNSPTLTARMTQMGVILGTAAYMAPEQAKGKPVDKRADIFSFGVVLYEMLTGHSLFVAETIPETLAHVMTRPVDLTTLPETTPRRVRELLGRCLEKDPRRRLRDIGEARLVLEDPTITAPDTAGSEDPASSRDSAPSAPPVPRWQRLLPWGLAALGLGAAVVSWAPWRTAPVVPSLQARFSYTLPEGVEFSRAGRQNLAISPDGTMVAFIANDQIYIRRLGELEAQPLRGSNVDPLDLVFSPDSQAIAFSAPETLRSNAERSTIKKIAIAGGAPVTLCPTTATFGLHWSGGRIVFSQGQHILSVAEIGGAPETLVEVAKESGETISRPQLVNGGKDLIYTVRPVGMPFNDGQIVLQPIGGARRVLVQGGSDGRLVSSGHLIWVRDSTLFAQPASATAQLSAGPVPVVEGVQFTATTGAGKYAVADNGTIAFLPGAGDVLSDLVWVDRQGREEKTGAPQYAYQYPRISPDGSRVAASASDGEHDIWIWDFGRKAMSRLTSGPVQDNYPEWTPDSRQVIYRAAEVSNPTDLFRRMADGTGTVEQLTKSPAFDTPFQVLRDLRVLALTSEGGGASFLYLLTPGNDVKATPLVPTSFRQAGSAEVSPDGRWIAYQSTEGSTVDEVHVRPFPNAGGGHWQISSGGGRSPMWSRNGKELFFRTFDRSGLMAVPVQATPGRPDFVFGPPVQVLDATTWRGGLIGRPFDISSDGQRFLVIIPVTANSAARPTITVITNWFDELRARAGGK